MKIPPKQINIQNAYELRLLSPTDGQAIFKAVSESLPSLMRFMHWAHYIEGLEEALPIYADFEAKSLRGEEMTFAGFDKASGEFLFCVSLSPGSGLNDRALELGYWVSSKHQGKGLGTIAARTMILLATYYYAADRISVVCNPENTPSLKVIEKCGFHFEGTLRNYLRKPSPKMLSEGYSSVRHVSCFSLLPEEVPQLGWVDAFCKEFEAISFSDKKISFERH